MNLNLIKQTVRWFLLNPPGSWILGLPYRIYLLERAQAEIKRDSQYKLNRLDDTVSLLNKLLASRLVVDTCHPSDGPLVSVIVPTHNRRKWLERCIKSVEVQNYKNWEIIVALDRCIDGSEELLKSIGCRDGRLKTVSSPKPGVAAARNCALENALGDIIVYLDDDNCFAQGWLSSVVWAFENHPSFQVLYGAIVLERPCDVNPSRLGGEKLPILMQQPFSRARLMMNNIADMGTISHRKGLPEAYFDEGLQTMHDWDFFGRLVVSLDPLVLPCPALIYRTDAPNRLSHLHEEAPEIKIIRNRLRSLYLDE